MASTPTDKRRRPARRRRVPRREREPQMLDAAAAIFGERGYYEAGMDEIAARAGISKPLLYAYFGSKQELYERAAERVSRRLYERIRTAVETAPTPELGLWEGTIAYFDFVEANRGSWVAGAPEGAPLPAPVSGSAREARAQITELVGELFRAAATRSGVGSEALEQSEPHAEAFVAVCEAGARWWLEHPDEPKDLQALRVMNFVWQGLGRTVEGDIWAPPPEWWAAREREDGDG